MLIDYVSNKRKRGMSEGSIIRRIDNLEKDLPVEFEGTFRRGKSGYI